VSSRVSPFCLIGFVDPNTGYLARCAEGYVERDGKTGASCCMHVRGDPAEQRRDADECAGGGEDEAAVAGLDRGSSVSTVYVLWWVAIANFRGDRNLTYVI